MPGNMKVSMARLLLCAGLYMSMAFVMAFITGCAKPKQPEISFLPMPSGKKEISIADSRGGLRLVEADAVYGVINSRSCAPLDYSALGGRRVFIEHRKKIAIDSPSGKGVVYSNFVQDQDYYGLGLCRWHLAGVNLKFVNGSGKNFSGMIQGDNLKLARLAMHCSEPNGLEFGTCWMTPIGTHPKSSYVIDLGIE